MAAFYDDNAASLIPSLRANTMLAHVRAAAYDSQVVLADENCHPFFFEGAPWLVAQNGYLPGWQVLQRELLQHCRDDYLTQMRGTTDTEFLAVLLLSLLEGESDEHVQRAVEQLVRLVADAMSTLQLPGLTKLKMALVSPGRVIGINWGLGHHGEVDPAGDWRELRTAPAGTDDFDLGMLLEPMYALLGRNFEQAGGRTASRSARRMTPPRRSSLPSPSPRTVRAGCRWTTGRSCSSRSRRTGASPDRCASSPCRRRPSRSPRSGRRAPACATRR